MPLFSTVAVVATQRPKIKVAWLPIYKKIIRLTLKCYTFSFITIKQKALLIVLDSDTVFF